jgi:hypothetical protein
MYIPWIFNLLSKNESGLMKSPACLCMCICNIKCEFMEVVRKIVKLYNLIIFYKSILENYSFFIVITDSLQI